MTLNRIASSSLSDQAVGYLQNNLSILGRLQEKLSSGKNILRPSDDPIGLTRILDIANTQQSDERYIKNIDDALSETSIADSSMTNMVDLVHRVQELATQAASFTNNQNGLNAIANEIDTIINQVVQLGNTNIAGKYMFAGFKADTPPFSRGGASPDDISYTGTPATEPDQRKVEISKNVEIGFNVNGQALLGSVAVSGTPAVATGTGLLNTLMSLKVNLQQGNLPNIRSSLDQIKTDLNGVLSLQARMGATTNQLELTKSRLNERKSILTQQYSSIQTIDTAKVVTDLNFQQNIFQASLSVSGKLLSTSLLDFIR
jgi:flagellar hook-associated protein 3 FlgL